MQEIVFNIKLRLLWCHNPKISQTQQKIDDQGFFAKYLIISSKNHMATVENPEVRLIEKNIIYGHKTKSKIGELYYKLTTFNQS